MGEKIFIMQRIGRQEFALNANHDVVRTYNKMHAGFLSVGGMGDRWGKKKMEILHEEV